MTTLNDRILSTLDDTFDYGDSDWVPSYDLMHKLKLVGSKESISDVIRHLEVLASQGLVEFSPTKVNGVTEGFITRLAVRGYNQLHFQKPSLVR